MIYLFYGENEFEKRAALTELIGGENVERHDGDSLSCIPFSDRLSPS